MNKYSHIFETDHLQQDLKRTSVHGGFWTAAAMGATQILQVGSIIILARILHPEDFGLVSMVTTLTAVAERFKDLGLPTATIQHKDITHQQVSTLFWINASVGLLIALLIVGCSQGLASFYKQPSVAAIASTLSLSFVFSGLTVQHQALLRRQMRFWALACIQVLAYFFSSLLAIGLAVSGYTYWAIIWREVSRAGFEVCGSWIACRWWPSWPAPRSGIDSLLRTGRDLVGVDTIYFASRSMDQLLVGKFAGAYALGLYKQAFQLMALPIRQLISFPIGYVALPSLSALQDQPDRYQRYYKRILSLLSFVSIPLITYMAIFSEDIIRVVLGIKWIEAAPIFRVFALAALIEPLFSTCEIVMITQGKTQRCFWWALIYGICLVIGFSLGSRWGAIGVAAGYTVTNYVIMVPSLWFSFRDTPLSIKLFFHAISLPACFSVIMAGVLMLLAYSTASLHSVSRIGLSLLTALISYLGLWMAYPTGRKSIFADVSYLHSVFKPVSNVRSSQFSQQTAIQTIPPPPGG